MIYPLEELEAVEEGWSDVDITEDTKLDITEGLYYER